jgi:hypothetical protein
MSCTAHAGRVARAIIAERKAIPSKTGLEAAKHYFKDNLTQSYKQHSPQGHNLSEGLYFLAEALQQIEERLGAIEGRLNTSGEAQPRQK